MREDMRQIMNESVSTVENRFDDRTNEMKLNLDKKFDKLMKEKEMQDEENKVALTAQFASAPSTNGIMKFDNVIVSVGYNNLSVYKSTGKFVCERSGLYLISASISSGVNNARYYLYLNNKRITTTMLSYSSNSPSPTMHTGTIVLVLQLHPNDSVWVKNGGTSIYIQW
ncbi:Hypothetical predicted protein [Mytilus galloprovincialis]|uniref:C1q domain-containing protein n=1 Tax=Mytilus galloprovincialis TaxID=29158 RepID=A0A8B6GU43_MYTGA|nr:Hypothetical predicted protein [Mytilus galloprovincialis]